MNPSPHLAPHLWAKCGKPLKFKLCRTVPHRFATEGVASVASPLVNHWRHTRQAEGASLWSYAPSKRLGLRVPRHSEDA